MQSEDRAHKVARAHRTTSPTPGTFYITAQPFLLFLSGGSLASTASSRSTQAAKSGLSLAEAAQHSCTSALSSLGTFLPHLPASESSECRQPWPDSRLQVPSEPLRGTMAGHAEVVEQIRVQR